MLSLTYLSVKNITFTKYEFAQEIEHLTMVNRVLFFEVFQQIMCYNITLLYAEIIPVYKVLLFRQIRFYLPKYSGEKVLYARIFRQITGSLK